MNEKNVFLSKMLDYSSFLLFSLRLSGLLTLAPAPESKKQTTNYGNVCPGEGPEK
jgi:hypothetical protein